VHKQTDRTTILSCDFVRSAMSENDDNNIRHIMMALKPNCRNYSWI